MDAKNFHLEATEFTPQIAFDVEQSSLRIAGFSRPEDVKGFYQQFVDWIQKSMPILITKKDHIQIHFELDYFNSASAKFLLDILMVLKRYYKDGMEMTWVYETGDEDMLETGQEFSDATGIPFEFLEKK